MKWNPIQEEFSAGEISPRFYAQQSSELYRKGLHQCINMIPTPQGPVTRRRGTTFIQEILSSAGLPVSNARIFPGNFTDEDWLLMILAGGRIEVLTSATSSSTEKQIIENPNFDQGYTGWTVNAIGNGQVRYYTDQPGGPRMWIGASLGSYASIYQHLVITEPNDVLRFRYRIRDDRPEYTNQPYNIIVRVSKTGHNVAPFIYDETHYSHVKNQEFSFNRDILLGAGYTGPLYVSFLVIAPSGSSNYMSVVSCEADILVTPPTSIPIMDTGLPDAHIDQVQYVQNPYERQVVFVHPLYPPKELKFDGTTWSFTDITFTGTPAWTAQTGYPRTCGAYQGRLVFAGWDSDPQRVVMSKPGNWRDFTPGANADDGVDLTLTEVGIAQWVAGQKECLVGTLNGEQVVSSETGLLQPGDIHSNMQSAYGSKHMQGADIGDQLIFASSDGRKVRAAEYIDQSKGWTSQDITYPSEHITISGVKRPAFSRDPMQILWCVLENGEIAAATYERGVDVIGWHRHNTWGQFIDVCSLRVAGTDVPFFLVARQIEGVRRIYLEAMYDITNKEFTNFLDCTLHRSFGTPQSLVSGLGHLEGLQVAVFADGAVQEGQTVTGGQIDLQYPASNVSIGLLNWAQVVTLPASVPPTAGGLGSMKNFTEVGVRLFESAPPVINGTQYPDRTSTSPMDSRERDISGDLYQLDTGTDHKAQITVAQVSPLPLTILGIYGRLSVSDL